MIIKMITMNDNSNNYDNNNNRTGGAVFEVRGPVTTPFEVEEGRGWGVGSGVGENSAVLSLW